MDLAGYESLMEQAREASRRTVAEEHAITLTPDAIAALQHMAVDPTRRRGQVPRPTPHGGRAGHLERPRLRRRSRSPAGRWR